MLTGVCFSITSRRDGRFRARVRHLSPSALVSCDNGKRRAPNLDYAFNYVLDAEANGLYSRGAYRNNQSLRCMSFTLGMIEWDLASPLVIRVTFPNWDDACGP